MLRPKLSETSFAFLSWSGKDWESFKRNFEPDAIRLCRVHASCYPDSDGWCHYVCRLAGTAATWSSWMVVSSCGSTRDCPWMMRSRWHNTRVSTWTFNDFVHSWLASDRGLVLDCTVSWELAGCFLGGSTHCRFCDDWVDVKGCDMISDAAFNAHSLTQTPRCIRKVLWGQRHVDAASRQRFHIVHVFLFCLGILSDAAWEAFDMMRSFVPIAITPGTLRAVNGGM